MASFLLTPRMSPALAARIQVSLQGKRRAGTRRTFVPRISGAAMIPIAAILVALALMLLSRFMTHRELEQARGELLERIATQRATLPPQAAGFLPSAQSWVARTTGAWEGDRVSDELRKPGALQARLSRPALFIRGDLNRLSRPDQLMEAAVASVKDAVLLCMSDPPDSREDKTVLQKVRGANFAAVLPSVHRFYDAEAGLRLLQPWWEAQVRAATDVKLVQNLRAEWLRAPIEDGKQAVLAELLVVVVNEPPELEPNAEKGDGRRPEERPHAIRMGIVDLLTQSWLLRLRRNVDAGSYPPAMRAAHARAITGCLFALEVRDAVRP